MHTDLTLFFPEQISPPPPKETAAEFGYLILEGMLLLQVFDLVSVAKGTLTLWSV